ncbi:MAG TPA: hypothetical protein VGL45_04500 [Bradyrhizobium sp.]
MKTRPALLLSCALTVVSGTAVAQAPPAPTVPSAQTAPTAPDRATGCTPTQTTPKGSIAPNGTTTGQSQAPLGDKLARSDGVLCPPSGVDPQMRAPAPETGTMPVIPPPGSPGGDPTIRPK